MKLKKINIDLIKPYWRNPRNNAKSIAAVKNSIEQYGYSQPIAVDTENVIVVGHSRYKALRELGFTDIEVIVLDLPADKLKQYRIVDNKTAELAEWDNDKLTAEIREIVSSFEDFATVFPEFKDMLFESVQHTGQTFVPVSQQYIDDKTEAGMGQFATAAKAANDALIEVMCPDCGHTFSISRFDKTNRPV